MLLLGNRENSNRLIANKNAVLEVKSWSLKQLLIMLNPCRMKKGIFSSKCLYNFFKKIFILLQRLTEFFQLFPAAGTLQIQILKQHPAQRFALCVTYKKKSYLIC